MNLVQPKENSMMDSIHLWLMSETKETLSLKFRVLLSPESLTNELLAFAQNAELSASYHWSERSP